MHLNRVIWAESYDQSQLFLAVADPGFPVGGGAVDYRGGYISKILYVETKESWPLGGACDGHAP